MLITVLDGVLAFGDLPVLDGADLTISAGDRIGLIGRNGAGKSSLLAVLAGRIELDAGRVVRRDGLAIVAVEQEPLLPAAASLRESLAIRAGLDALAEADERQRWALAAAIDRQLDRYGLDGAADPVSLSGGERKRAAIALAFAHAPELLLLDEPTNHLDIDAIEQLERLCRDLPALVVITHDRRFLDAVANRIVELDRGRLHSFPGGYTAFEQARGEQLLAEAVARRRFDRFWTQEEAWIRQGVEARRTRNEGRVRRLQALRAERDARRERAGSLAIDIDPGERSGRLVCELQGVTKRIGDRTLVGGLDLTLARGDRLGLIGPNGAGKSTLIRLMVGEVEPDDGRIRRGTNLTLAYFDQLREQLDEDRSVAETISPGSDYVEIAGSRRHVMSYLSDFLFSPRQARSPVRALSGGERNRLLLARLFARPANWLIMDEPTNDLDLESIELLEATLQTYAGTLVMVSHDRAFLDNVVTSVLAAEGDGHWVELPGGYSDWQAWRERSGGTSGRSSRASAGPSAQASAGANAQAGAGPSARASAGSSAEATDGTSDAPAAGPIDSPAARRPAERLSQKEARELQELPTIIETLEAEQHGLQAEMANADFFRQPIDRIREHQQRLVDCGSRLEAMMTRWEVLLAKEQRVADAAADRGR
ncbi:MAG: ATP-binding cassette domain-containing protein [Burkholderiaceae bacterium]